MGAISSSDLDELSYEAICHVKYVIKGMLLNCAL